MFSDGAQIACVMKLSITNPRKSSFYSVNLMFSFVHLSVEELTHLMSRYLDCARHATLFFLQKTALGENTKSLSLISLNASTVPRHSFIFCCIFSFFTIFRTTFRARLTVADIKNAPNFDFCTEVHFLWTS